jgi:triacylglycerol lipase
MIGSRGQIGRRISLTVAGLALVAGLAPRAASAMTDAPPKPGPLPEDGAAPLGANDWDCQPSAAHPEPLVLVHGLGATAEENFGYLSPKLKNAGYCVFALTYGEKPGNPYIGGLLPMQESAKELGTFVDRVLAATGAAKIDLVGHSEGTVMPQWWLKKLGGAAVTKRYVALAPLYAGTTLYGLDTLIDTLRGLSPEGAAPFSDAFDQGCGSCQQFLNGSDFYKDLYSDGTIAAPGVTYTTVMSRYDEVVIPYTSGQLTAPGATNIVLQGVCPLNLDEHGLLAFDPAVARIILNALDPAHPKPVDCGPLAGVGLGGLNDPWSS